MWLSGWRYAHPLVSAGIGQRLEFRTSSTHAQRKEQMWSRGHKQWCASVVILIPLKVREVLDVRTGRAR